MEVKKYKAEEEEVLDDYLEEYRGDVALERMDLGEYAYYYYEYPEDRQAGAHTNSPRSGDGHNHGDDDDGDDD